MGICNTVEAFSSALSQEVMIEDPRHKLQLEILKLMPLYRDIRDLSQWESAFTETLEEAEDESTVGEIIYAIFDFGRCNMYCAFSEDNAIREFSSLKALVEKKSLFITVENPDLSCW